MPGAVFVNSDEEEKLNVSPRRTVDLFCDEMGRFPCVSRLGLATRIRGGAGVGGAREAHMDLTESFDSTKKKQNPFGERLINCSP